MIGMIDTHLFFYAGILIPWIYMLLYLVGGALRSDYNHVKNSVSELLSPGAPNKSRLIIIQIVYALLYIVFGFAVLGYYTEIGDVFVLGKIGSWMIVALGITTLGTVIFPQDAEGTPETRAGQLHKILVFGGLIPFSIVSTLFMGLWFRQAGLFPGFDVYSFVTVGAVVVMGAIGGITIETRFAGLVERIAALVTQQWFFVLGLTLLQQ